MYSLRRVGGAGPVVPVRRMRLEDLSPRVRFGLYAAAVAVLLYLCLAPSDHLPTVNLWDKAEHGIAWAVLAGAGLVLFPRRAWRIVLFAVVFGAVIEVLQGLPAIHRDSDVRDWIADIVGVSAAWLVCQLIRRARR